MRYFTKYNSFLGELILISDGNYLTGLNFSEAVVAVRNDSLEIFIKTKNWLDRYFSGNQPNLNELELNLEGSEFSKIVWDELCKIPYGHTITYGQLAKVVQNRLGKDKMSAQAVGGAVGRNPIAIIVPCHRVIGTNGKLIGYAGGLDKKIKLLQLEKAI